MRVKEVVEWNAHCVLGTSRALSHDSSIQFPALPFGNFQQNSYYKTLNFYFRNQTLLKR